VRGGCGQPPFATDLRECAILLAKLVAREMNDDGAAVKGNTPIVSPSTVAPSGEIVLTSRLYTLDKKRRRVLAGLTPEETTEFELLDAQLPLDGKPAWRHSELPLSPKEQRWLELFRRTEAARKQTAA
jgi:hypothetical protein